MLNKFMVSGRLTADPEVKTTGESRYCKFSIACDRPKPKSVKISSDTYAKYFSNGEKPKEVTETIEKALAFYFEHMEEQ